ncbi:NAD-dependent epimerase/dehydratase family protein [Patescibacteria group bacterium]|nr:NAD-dependent epimerase/dehydratase family protein [Patescibacteria group bacterium]
MNNSNFNWKTRKVLVTGGTSFIGSTLTDKLVELGTSVRVVDDLSSGKIENLEGFFTSGREIEFLKADLREPGVARRAVDGIDTVFHLAGDHGGRGYVDLHQAGPASNLLLDGIVFWEAMKAGVEKIVFASSGCVYPNSLQSNPKKELYLTEELVKPPHDADNMYGWAKLMGEETLRAYYGEHGIKTASCRYFTVYGPRGKEDHAVIAMIARAFIKQDPFEVWGNGQQVRNWTYVDDIVKGTILMAEKVDDGSALNLGTMERIKVIEAVKMILKETGHRAKIKLLKDMPTGPMNRVADNSLAKKLLGWEPEVKFADGIKKTIDWYFKTKKKSEVKKYFERSLTER